MKTKEEIEQLADERYLKRAEAITDSTIKGYIVSATKGGFVDGYTQCQEDMADKKYTELQLRFFANELIKGVEEKNKQGYEDIKVDYESLILSLNK